MELILYNGSFKNWYSANELRATATEIQAYGNNRGIDVFWKALLKHLCIIM